MQSETKYTKQDLETMRAWSLQRKIQVTQTRIIEWIGRYDWNVYISFSGGKDSTVLADLTARAYQAFWCPNRKEPLHLVFVNTGLEYPEIQKFVKYFAKWLERQYEIPVDLKVLTPELTFPEVLTKYGYPVIGKEVAKVIYYARHGSQWALNRLDGLDKRGKPSKFKERYKKYKFMVEAPFSTSQLCCDVMKKGPAKKYEKETGRKPIVATMTEESEQRQASWLRYGCNSFDSERPMSKPMSFWTEQDVLQYLKQTGIPYAPVYGEIVEENMQLQMFDEEFPPKLTTTGCDRTGCMYCMFGIIITVIMTIGSVVVPALLAGFEAFSAGIGAVMSAIQGIFQGLITFITGVFSGSWSQAWEGIKQIFGSAFDGLVALCKAPLNAVIAIINKAISGINGLGLTIPEWVPILGGKSFSVNIPTLPMLARGGFTDGVSIAGEAGTEAVISFQRGVRSDNINTWTQAGRMLGVSGEQAAVAAGVPYADGGGAVELATLEATQGNNAVELQEIDTGKPQPEQDGGGTPDGGGQVVFAPQITVQGNADRAVLESVLDDAQQRFEMWYEQMMRRKARTAY